MAFMPFITVHVGMASEAEKAALKNAPALKLAAAGAITLKKNARDPDSFVLEDVALRADEAICYTYRARNGFGGMNRENAVLSHDRKKFLQSGDAGFVRLWNHECSGKTGKNITGDVQVLM